jgi:proteasome lid subunit RPN8/RPN11
LKKKHRENIARHARDKAPVEACGILVGRRVEGVRVVERVVRARNVLASPYRYEIDPDELYRVFTRTDEAGEEVVGFYHSHPYSDASFSGLDRSSAHYTNCSYLIYSNLTGTLRSFLWDGEEEEVQVID